MKRESRTSYYGERLKVTNSLWKLVGREKSSSPVADSLASAWLPEGERGWVKVKGARQTEEAIDPMMPHSLSPARPADAPLSGYDVTRRGSTTPALLCRVFGSEILETTRANSLTQNNFFFREIIMCRPRIQISSNFEQPPTSNTADCSSTRAATRSEMECRAFTKPFVLPDAAISQNNSWILILEHVMFCFTEERVGNGGT